MAYESRFNKSGNIKIGEIWSYNKLAGAGEINGVKGTCGRFCTGCYNAEEPKKSSCYVFSSYLRYGWENSTPVKGHIRNTLAMRNNPEKVFKELGLQIKRARVKPVAIRIHSSGEIENVNELKGWFNLARENPEIPFYIYTKAYNVVNAVLLKEEMPDNFYLNISIWHNVGINCYNKWKHLPNVRAFAYCDGYKYPFKMDVMCPAYDEKGKMNHNFTCDKCKICYKKTNKVTGCYSH